MTNENERISFAGGEMRANAFQSNALRGTEVWNRDPLPKPPPPPPPPKYTYKLTVQHVEGNAVATAETMELLVAFEQQLRQLGYQFVKLERLDETGTKGAGGEER